MLEQISPGLIVLAGGLVVPLLPRALRPLAALLVPLLGLWHLLTLDHGIAGQIEVLGFVFTTLRLDSLSFVFALIFLLIGALNSLYGWHVRDRLEQGAALVYAGAAIAAVFAGDLVSLFIFWEITGLASVFLIWARGTERARKAGTRYLVIQIFSGVLLLEGIAFLYKATGSIAFDAMALDGLGAWIIFLAFGIKCAFPFLHNWLQDAYPEATPFGAVVLSAFTTKMAVYALARGFPGTDLLIPIGAVMTVFPVFFAVIENDLRRVLAYSLNNQLGFMVVGIGIGTPLALNGAIAHAFCHILYKALLFMSMGAVLHRAGTTKATDLGGLYKSMPFTAVFCIIGGLSISAFPLFSGFVSKSLTLEATAAEGLWLAWGALLFASAGVLEHSGIKVPYFAFFGHDRGLRVREAPWNMLAAMALAAALSIGLGVWPEPLYALLPYPVAFDPYTAGHVLAQLQLLLFAVLAFVVLMWLGFYPPERRSINLDFDWTYRRLAPEIVAWARRRGGAVHTHVTALLERRLSRLLAAIYRHHGPQGVLARTWPTGSTVLWVTVLLGVSLLLYYV